MRSFFDGTENPREKIMIDDEKQLTLIIITLIRMLWSLKEFRSSPIYDLHPGGLDKARQPLLKAVENLYQNPVALMRGRTRGERLHIAHRTQLMHVAHLYGSWDLMNFLYPSLRGGNEAETAKAHIFRWAAADADRVREVAYHSAQILALARQYPNNIPLEPFIIFHAGAVLSCVASILPSGKPDYTGPALRLDYLGEDEATLTRLSSWRRSGGCMHLCLHGVPSLCCRLGRQQVLDQTAELLKRRSVWGIAHSFTGVIVSLFDDEI